MIKKNSYGIYLIMFMSLVIIRLGNQVDENINLEI